MENDVWARINRFAHGDVVAHGDGVAHGDMGAHWKE